LLLFGGCSEYQRNAAERQRYEHARNFVLIVNRRDA